MPKYPPTRSRKNQVAPNGRAVGSDGNIIHIGDNLEVLISRVPDATVDLVYLDPPFNSQTIYRVRSKSQGAGKQDRDIPAFSDFWRWGPQTEAAYQKIMDKGPKRMADLLRALHGSLGNGSMMAYLVMMAPRLAEMHRTLKRTGSIYLHCDPTASHYLKLVMDAIFGPSMFRNEIAWNRSQSRSSIRKVYRRAHDTILLYTKTDRYTFHMQYKELSDVSKTLYRAKDDRGSHQLVPLLVSGSRRGKTGRAWRGIDPNSRGKSGMHWITDPDNLENYQRQGLIHWPKKQGGAPRLKYYLEGNQGVPLNDFWADVAVISSSSSESTGFPTQKPEALLCRVIAASSNPGDVVLDPFAGSGTSVTVAEAMGRRWIAIDNTYLSLALVKHRLEQRFGDSVSPYDISGGPKDMEGARVLACEDLHGFRWWALSLLGALPAYQAVTETQWGVHGYLTASGLSSQKHSKIAVMVLGAQDPFPPTEQVRSILNEDESLALTILSLNEVPQSLRIEAEAAGHGAGASSSGSGFPGTRIISIADALKGKRAGSPVEERDHDGHKGH